MILAMSFPFTKVSVTTGVLISDEKAAIKTSKSSFDLRNL